MSTLSGLSISAAERSTWLQERSSGIGSSDAAAAVGVSKWKTKVALWLEKTTGPIDLPPNDAMRWGLRLEPVLADAYRDETGRNFAADQLFIRSEENPWMLATLDRVTDDGRIVELKTANAHSANDWGEPGTDEIPQGYLVQVIHQMAVAKIHRADVAVLIGGQDFRIYTVDYSDSLASKIIGIEAEFWKCVETRTMPEIDPDRDRSLMGWLYPKAEGEIEFGPDNTLLVEQWQAAKDSEGATSKTKDRMKGEILALMGEHKYARLDDGRVLTRSVVDVAEATVIRKGYRRVDLRVK